MRHRVLFHLTVMLLILSWPLVCSAQVDTPQVWPTIDLTRKPISTPPPEKPEPRFRVEIQGEVAWQKRLLDSPFPISESVERAVLSTGDVSTRTEQTTVSHLDEQVRLELVLIKLFYRLTERIEVNGKIGTGRLVTKIDNLRGQFLVEEFIDSLPLFSLAFPFSDPNSHEGSGSQGFAAGAGVNVILLQSAAPNLALILGSQWTYLQSDDILNIRRDVEIEESRTHLVDVGLTARHQRGRFSGEAGVGITWLLTEYEGHFTKRIFDFGSAEGFSLKTEKTPFSFSTGPKAFPVVGRLGFEYSVTDSIGLKVQGTAGNSQTYSVTGGFYYRF